MSSNDVEIIVQFHDGSRLITGISWLSDNDGYRALDSLRCGGYYWFVGSSMQATKPPSQKYLCRYAIELNCPWAYMLSGRYIETSNTLRYSRCCCLVYLASSLVYIHLLEQTWPGSLSECRQKPDSSIQQVDQSHLPSYPQRERSEIGRSSAEIQYKVRSVQDETRHTFDHRFQRQIDERIGQSNWPTSAREQKHRAE